jgi:hypothetical protein
MIPVEPEARLSLKYRTIRVRRFHRPP